MTRANSKSIWSRNASYLVLFAALLLLPWLLTFATGEPPNKGMPLFVQGLMIQVLIWAVFALSYDILMGHIGILSFGHALFFGTGAYAVGILVKYAQWSLPVAILAVIIITGLESFILGVLSLRVRGTYFAMVTLAFATVAFILVEATDFRDWTGAEDGLHGVPFPDILNPAIHRVEFYYLAVAFAVAAFLLVRLFVDSPAGRVWSAIRENEARAVSIGYNTLLFKVQATMVSGILAGLAGALDGMFNMGANPMTMDTGTTINALLMTIIGGSGTLIGPMIGAAVLQLLGYVLNLYLGDVWQLVFGLIYVLLVLFLPYGIVGTWRSRNLSWRGMWNSTFVRWSGMLRGAAR